MTGTTCSEEDICLFVSYYLGPLNCRVSSRVTLRAMQNANISKTVRHPTKYFLLPALFARTGLLMMMIKVVMLTLMLIHAHSSHGQAGHINCFLDDCNADHNHDFAVDALKLKICVLIVRLDEEDGD